MDVGLLDAEGDPFVRQLVLDRLPPPIDGGVPVSPIRMIGSAVIARAWSKKKVAFAQEIAIKRKR